MKAGVKNARVDGNRFLNYKILKSSNKRVIRRGGGTNISGVSRRRVAIRLDIPNDRIIGFSKSYGVYDGLLPWKRSDSTLRD